MRKGGNSNHSITLLSPFAVLFFLMLLPAPRSMYGAVGVWSSCRGPGGGIIRSLAVDPTSPQTIYAGTHFAGLVKSTDAGGSWSVANTGLTTEIFVLAIDPTSPQTIYAGGGGVFKSTDAGGTWSAMKTGLSKGAIHALAIDPTSPQTIYAGGGWMDYDSIHGGVFKSTNGAGSWNTLNAGLPDTAVNALAIDPTSPQRIYAGTNVGVFKSTDAGGTWSAIHTGFYIQTLAIDPTSPQTIYAGTLFYGVFKSRDAGDSWSAVNTGLTDVDIQTLALDPTSPQTVYVGSWRGGVFKSTNGGGSWSTANTGLTNLVVLALAIDRTSPQTIYAGTFDGGVFKSTDACGSWSAINTGLTNDVITLAIDPTSPQTIYAGSDQGAVFKSTDAGSTWSAINPGMTHSRIETLAIDPTSPQTIYAGTGVGVFKSTDAGGSWINMGLTYKGIKALAIDPTSPQTIYAGTQFGVFKSTDAGGSWINTSLPASYISTLVIDPTSPQTIYAGNYGGMFRSMDAGGSWSAASTGLTSSYIVTLATDPTSPQTIYAGTDGGVFKSTNGGDSWVAINTGLSNYTIYALMIDDQSPGILYAATGAGGVWRYPMVPLTSTDLDLFAGGAAQARTVASKDPTLAGYARVSVNSGAVPYGTAVFSFKQNGVTVSEAGVPASPPTTRARLFIDYRSGVLEAAGHSDAGTIDIDTGIAIVNCGSATANIRYTLRDLAGATLSTGHGILASGGHFAKFIDQLKEVASGFNLPANFQTGIGFGSLDISSDQPLSIVALRETINQRREALLTTTPIADLSQPPATDPIYYPQFVDGGGYTSALVLLNASGTVETGTLRVFDDNGAALAVNQVGGTTDSSFRYSISVGGVFRFQTDGFPASVKAGWVLLTPDAGTSRPVGAGVFSYSSGGILVSESGIPAAVSTTHARVYVDLSRGHDTGVAIANPTSMNTDITISAYRTDGVTPVGTSQGPLQLPGNGHSAKFATEFIAGLPAGFTGVLDITSATPFAALTLRSLNNERNDFLMTTFPIADADRTAPSPVVFPQIADGGGFVTEFILLNAGGASRTTLSFFDNEGRQLAVGK